MHMFQEFGIARPAYRQASYRALSFCWAEEGFDNEEPVLDLILLRSEGNYVIMYVSYEFYTGGSLRKAGVEFSCVK